MTGKEIADKVLERMVPSMVFYARHPIESGTPIDGFGLSEFIVSSCIEKSFNQYECTAIKI